MNLFRNISLIVKLGFVMASSLLVMAAVAVFAVLEVATQKNQVLNEIQGQTTLRLVQDYLVEHDAAFSSGARATEQVSAVEWDETRFDLPQAEMNRISEATGAHLGVLVLDQTAGMFRPAVTNAPEANGSLAIDTPLERTHPAHAALVAGSRFVDRIGVSGSEFLTIYEPIRNASGAVTGAIAVALPQSTLTNATRGIVSGVSWWLAIAVAGGFTATMTALWLLLRPLGRIAKVVSAMARKSFDVELSNVKSNDEIGRLAKAVADLRNDLAESAQVSEIAASKEAEEERQRQDQIRVVADLKAGLARLADGDLTRRIESPPGDPFPETYEALRESYNAVIDRVGGVLARVTSIAGGVRKSSETITNASRDLSGRTETQAATLEESAAALNQLTVSVRSTAERAEGAEEASRQNRAGAQNGAHVVGQAVEAMQGIEKSSEQITRIIGVIDDIAFQTNLLALNAGVEAARAGEAGRGFAVVASEVRLLAQRASDSAREIKELISKSAEQVQTGSSLVNQAGEALSDILERAQRAGSFVEEIASAASEQANGLKEINTGVNQLDHATQQNRAVSEETTASASDLLTQADQLIHALSEFRVEGGASLASSQIGTGPGTDGLPQSVSVTPKVADWQAAADAAANTPRAQPTKKPAPVAAKAPATASTPASAPAAEPVAAAGGSWHEF